MSMNNLTVEGEFRYIIQWFSEWSELQRDDFIPILIDYLVKETPGVYVNGVVSGLANTDVMDKPMSLFQCRIKLFKEWSPKWPEDMKHKLRSKIIELDPKVGEKIMNELKGLKVDCITPMSNGNPAITEELIAAAVAVVEETEIALNATGALNSIEITANSNILGSNIEEINGVQVQEFSDSIPINEEVPLVA